MKLHNSITRILTALLLGLTLTSSLAEPFNDGDGHRVWQIEPNGDRTVYVGGRYEATYRNGEAIRTCKYYVFGAQTVAVRENGVLSFVHGDHLGSSTLTTNAQGQVLSTNSYYPFGAARAATGQRPTSPDFTGQRLGGTGLHFYHGRYYDNALVRFASADTLVPEPGGSQAYNRYAYVYNNPVKFKDATGHCPGCAEVILVAVPVVLVVGALYVSWEYYLGPNAAQHRTDLEKSLNALAESLNISPSAQVAEVKLAKGTEGLLRQTAEHMSKMQGGESIGGFPGFEPPDDDEKYKQKIKEQRYNGEDVNDWVKEINNYLKQMAEKNPNMTLEQMLQKTGLEQQEIEHYMLNLQRTQFTAEIWEGNGVSSQTISTLKSLMQQLGVPLWPY